MLLRLVSFGILLLLLNSNVLHAQVNACAFSPLTGGSFHVPIGRSITIHTTAVVGLWARGNISEAYFAISAPTWATVDPPGLTARWSKSYVDIAITLRSDTARCFGMYPWITMQNKETQVGTDFAFGVAFYDSSIIGHALRGHDSIRFGAVKVKDSASANAGIYFDSLVQFRNFVPLNVLPPFYSRDSVPLSYPCDYRYVQDLITFRPTTTGHFVDTIYLRDPLTDDSIPRILIADGIEENGVSDPLAPTFSLQLYPNPSRSSCLITTYEDELDKVEIENLLGVVVRSAEQVRTPFTVDTRNLPTGRYILRATSKTRVLSKSLIVRH